MGLLDFFNGGADPYQTQGLLAAAAQMLQQSGPSRTPTSFGQILGGGLTAYNAGSQNAQNLDLQREAAKQEAQLRDLRIQGAQGDLGDQQQARDHAAKLADFISKFPAAGQSAQAPAPAFPGGQSAASMMQGFASGAPQAPMPQAPSAPDPVAAQPMDGASVVDYHMKRARYLASGGFDKEANDEFALAQKAQPKYSTDFRVALNPADGKLHNYVLSDDGAPPKDTGLAVRPEVTEVDLGGMKQFVDKNTVAPNQIFKKTLSPDAAASNALGYARLNFDKSQADDGAGNMDLSNSTVDAIGQGRMAPPSGYALRNPKIANLMDRVAAKYPDFDATDYAGKSKAVRDFTTGKQGDAIRSFSVASDHLTQLKGLITALDNGDTPLINRYGNIIAQQTGSVAPTNFDAAKGIVAKEVLKSIVAGGGGVDERQELAHLLDNAKTAAQLNGVVDTYQHLMSAQRDGLVRQYELSTGRKDAASRFNYNTNSQPTQPTQPSPGNSPTPAVPQKTDMLPPAAQASGKRYKADNGTVYRSDGTKWIKE